MTTTDLTPIDPELLAIGDDPNATFSAIVAELTRRGFLGGAAGTAGLLSLAACGRSSSAARPTAPAFRAIDTVKGSVRVPADPRRVVAIQPSAAATLYDLGLDPIGVYDEGAQYISPRYRTKWTATSKVGDRGQIDIEKVAALDPDLIIGVNYSWNTDVYHQLSHFAPTVIAPATRWQATARAVANAVNRLPALATLDGRLRARSAQIKATYTSVLAKYRWDLLQGGFDSGQFWLYGPGSDVGMILTGAGVQCATASSQVRGNGNRSLSYERIDVLASAGVIGFYANYNGTPNNEGPELFAQPGFKALAAVRADRLVPIPDFLPGGYGDALAVLDELEAGLKKLGA